MRKFKKIVASLLTLTMCLGLTACGGTGGKESKAPIASANVPADPFPAESQAVSNGPSDDAPVFDIDLFEYGELKDVGTNHIPAYPAILCDGTVAMPYGTVETKEVGYTGETDEIGSTPRSYSASWSGDSEQRLEDVPISNADGLLLTLNSNIDASYILPFDVGQHISAARDELLQAYKGTLTAYADLVEASGLGEILMGMSAYVSGDDLDADFLDMMFSWSQYLLLTVDIDYFDSIPDSFDEDMDLFAWVSSAGDRADNTEELSAYKRFLKSFDPSICSIYEPWSQKYYIYYDETIRAAVRESSTDGVDYILNNVDFDSVDGFTFSGMALDTSEDVVRVFGVPTQAELSWKPDSGSPDTANAYLPYVTYTWEYAHVYISMECEPVLSGGTVTFSPSVLRISCR